MASLKNNTQMILLLAEDEENDVVLFQRALRKAGVNVCLQRVADGEEAIEHLKGKGKFNDRVNHPFPDLVVVDLKMPRKNGFEVIEWIRSSVAKGLRVVVLTSSQERKDVNRAFDSGANAYMTKPHNFEELVGMIKNLHVFWAELSEQPDIPRSNPSKEK
jgi:DNA-binding response OmpR family regulator